MPLSKQAVLAYKYFILNHGQLIDIDSIANETSWSESTVRTYISKKWKGTVLKKSTNGFYQVILPKNTTEDQFFDLQTQVDKRTRT